MSTTFITAKPLKKRARLPHYFGCHIRAFFSALSEILKKPWASLMTLTAIGIAMTLPMGFYLLLYNFDSVSNQWNESPNISVYVSQTQQVPTLEKNISSMASVAEVQYITPEQGLATFKKQADLGGLLNSLDSNPLPGVLVVVPKLTQQTPTAMTAIANQLKKLPNIDSVQMDSLWVQRLTDLIDLGKRLTYGLIILFGFAVILITGNTIRLQIQKHQKEITVLKLVGATHAFIRRPLLYQGLLYGLGGGLIAWLLVTALLLWLKTPAQSLIQSYDKALFWYSLPADQALWILASCALLGLIGAWVNLFRYLR